MRETLKAGIRSILKWFRGWMHGGPHFVVGPPGDPYLWRWYLLPRNPWFNAYIHKFLRDDDDRALHDHPWNSFSILVYGRYVEETSEGRKAYKWGNVRWRSATFSHRIELPGGQPCWTLFLTGPRIREWGFWCAQGWVNWRDFTNPNAPGEVGRGCGDQPEAPA